MPSLPVQKRIAHILGSLDNKIELNRQLNETLEGIALALFKSWFVDFDPAKDKAEGRDPKLPKEIADLFPDSFEESELGMIPKGWKVVPLDKIANFLNGLACQKHPPVKGKKTLPVIKIREIRQGVTSSTDRANTDVPKQYIVQDGDILFSWSASLLVKIWCQGEGLLNQHVFKVSSDDYPKWFCYYWTQHHLEEFQRIAADKATTMGHIKRGHLATAKTLVPSEPLLGQMTLMIASTLEKQLKNELETKTLTKLRDTLLPKLLSGKLPVSNVDGMLEEQQ